MEMGKIINDFTINIATANGTGSQSANLILLNSLFKMGTHASGKNLFPSNIAGLPTWYIIRVSDHGYQAPGGKTDIQIAMNPDTWVEDIENLEPNTVLIYNTDTRLPIDREDLILYPVPMGTMGRKINPKLAKLVANMIYVGIVARNAVNKFNSNQLNRLLVFVITPSVISSSPTPANLKTSSWASSFKTVNTSSPVIIPTSLLFLSTTPAENKL